MPRKKVKPPPIRTDMEKIKGWFYLDFIPESVCFFKPGDPVRVGNLDNCFVVESFYDGKVYKVRHQENPKKIWQHYPEKTSFHEWFCLYIPEEEGTAPGFSVEKGIRESSSRIDINGLMAKVLRFGTDLDPEYQRGLVWNKEEKTSLLDSIFNHVEIGRFVFRNLPFKDVHTPNYEIIDGKQRLTTIVDFYLNRFKYRGYYFSQLNRHDKNIFKGFAVLVAEIENVTDVQVMKYFKKINKTSHPITKEHFSKIDDLIKEKVRV